jgi:hypothetical protein
MKKRFVMAAVTTLAVLGSPASSRAVTYCVNNPACPAGGDTSNTTLGAALNAAAASPNVADTILLGPGTYDDASGIDFQYADGGNPANDVTVQGAGVDQTTLTQQGHGSDPVLAFSNNPPAADEEVRDLAISLPDGYGGNVNTVPALQYPTQAENVRIVAQGSATEHAAGIAAPADALLTGLDIRLPLSSPGSSFGPAGVFSQDPGTMILADSSITAWNPVLLADAVKTAFLGLRLHGAGSGISGQFPGTTGDRSAIENTQIVMDGDGTGITGSADGSGPLNLAVRHVTIKAASTGLRVLAGNGQAASVNVRNSIIAGATTPVSVTTTGATAGTVAVSNSALPPTGDSASGTNAQINRASATNAEVADPLLVDAGNGDLHPRFDSPAIDLGDISFTGEPTDLAGQSRDVDGHGSGTAKPDAGAFEYQRRPPTVTASFGTPTTAGTPIAFSAAGSDPDPGDTVSFGWLFSDGATATGATAEHAFAAGPFAAFVTATDPDGLSASAALNGTAAAIPTPPDTTAPVVSGAAFSPKAFRASVDTNTPATAKRAPVGSTLKLKLSEQADLTIVIAQKRSGRRTKSGGKTTCRAETKKNRKAKHCTFYTTRATLKRAGVLAGSRSFAITGRFKGKALPHGSYRATISARDAAGNRSKDVTATFTIKR